MRAVVLCLILPQLHLIINEVTLITVANVLIIQLLRQDEELFGMLMKPRRPRAVVLCPTRELSEQVLVNSFVN